MVWHMLPCMWPLAKYGMLLMSVMSIYSNNNNNIFHYVPNQGVKRTWFCHMNLWCGKKVSCHFTVNMSSKPALNMWIPVCFVWYGITHQANWENFNEVQAVPWALCSLWLVTDYCSNMRFSLSLWLYSSDALEQIWASLTQTNTNLNWLAEPEMQQ